MKVHVAILMSERGPQAILPPVVLGQVPRDSDDGLSSRLEHRDSVDVRPVRAQVSILVQIPSLVFDQRLQILGVDRILDLTTMAAEERLDDRLAFPVEFL